jgi:hypothetical protein
MIHCVHDNASPQDIGHNALFTLRLPFFSTQIVNWRCPKALPKTRNYKFIARIGTMHDNLVADASICAVFGENFADGSSIPSLPPPGVYDEKR